MTTRAEALAQQKRRDKAATEARTLRCGGCRRAFDRALVSTMTRCATSPAVQGGEG